MRIEEARWIHHLIEKYGDEFFPLLNLGSSTKEFREVTQPWIHDLIFAPIEQQSIREDRREEKRREEKRVVHCDIKLDEGVDMVGNIFDSEFQQQLRAKNFKSVICSNVLEHIVEVGTFCTAIENVLPVGGYIIATVPNLYPYHKDPIDTKFRPTVEDVARLFRRCSVVTSEVFRCPQTHFFTLIKQPYNAMITVKNWLIPRYGLKEWRMCCSDIPNLFKKYKLTWVLLKKTA